MDFLADRVHVNLGFYLKGLFLLLNSLQDPKLKLAFHGPYFIDCSIKKGGKSRQRLHNSIRGSGRRWGFGDC